MKFKKRRCFSTLDKLFRYHKILTSEYVDDIFIGFKMLQRDNLWI